MRPIKFRAWMRRQFSHSSLTYRPYEMVYLDNRDGEDNRFWVLSGRDGEPMELDGGRQTDFPWTLMQFTGLYDRYGKEIYEGDIIERKYLSSEALNYYDKDRLHEKVERLTVEWKHDIQGFGIPNNKARFFSNPMEYSLNPNGLPEFYVIGNKYENPELLREVAQ